ncbi:acyl-CoA dehydrogenase [Actinomadura rugatobispora]|uniref:Acyl-CoA dehydrogenase n=1 Tax=Actinomadura rugatobispora TaxID=1994 RepID=A0ABW1A8H5_9ACTN|nr:acyl-CoA dehydrogenase [Actinomadura rugatobispora]
MGHYRSNLRDLEFNLFEVLGLRELLGKAPFADLDEDTARSLLAEVDRLATGVLADSFSEGDRVAPVFDAKTGAVTMAGGIKKSFHAWMDSEFYRLFLDPGFGGQSAPSSLAWAVGELAMAANPSTYLMVTGPTFAQILWQIGTPEQKRFADLALERRWMATMVLTEADAGSDVGAGRTRAIEQRDGTWHIQGVKRFITGADHDLSENIFHLVLARPLGAGPGSRGLSMFLVPKYLVDLETGELGERNGVYVTNLEKKMGLTSSTTCELTFGAKHPAVGYLVGDVHEGIKQMFMVIEGARMTVGVKAAGTLSTGYLSARDFASERIQGPDLTRMGDATAPRVAIFRHPDVRRSLMTQKAYAEGLRALYLLAASYRDAARVAEQSGGRDDTAERLNELVLPLVKGFSSERAYALLGAESLQTLGGSGFLKDYPLEQYVRDSKIDTLYEGTTAIQGLDLFFRKIVRDQGGTWRQLAGLIRDFTDSGGADDPLRNERRLLGGALKDVSAMVDVMTGWTSAAADDPEEIYKAGLNTTRLLYALGELVIGWLLCRQADIALTRLAGDGLTSADHDFYTGKITAARFFAITVLPHLTAERITVEATTLDLMRTPDTAF